jgi:hypothetical protein
VSPLNPLSLSPWSAQSPFRPSAGGCAWGPHGTSGPGSVASCCTGRGDSRPCCLGVGESVITC